MKISAKGKYAVQLMVDLVLHNTGSCIALKDVSRRQNISVKYLEQVVGSLTSNGFLKGSRGPQGGYKLAPGVEKKTVSDILRAVEGGANQLSAQEGDGEEKLSDDGGQAVNRMWARLYEVIDEYLSGITLEDIARESMESAQDDYCI